MPTRPVTKLLHSWGVFCLLLAFLQAAPVRALAAEASGEVAEGTLTDTARSAGKWECWFNAADARPIAANDTGIWFVAGGNVWRYNPKTQSVDIATSPLTHPDINDFLLNARVAADGRLALGCRAAILLWDTHTWTRLTQPNGDSNPHFVAFDDDLALWANSGMGACRWDKNHWTLATRLPQNSGTWSVAGGWFLWNNFGQGKEWKTHTWFNRDFSQHTEYSDTPPAAWSDRADLRYTGRGYQTPKGFIGEFCQKWEGPHTLALITKDSFTPLVTGKFPVLDLSTGEVFTAAESSGAATWSIQTPDSKIIATLPPMPLMKDDHAFPEVFFRDKNNHYFRRFWRCDGKQWQPMLPAHAFLFQGSMRDAIAAGRLAFDPVGDTWRPRNSNPGAPSLNFESFAVPGKYRLWTDETDGDAIVESETDARRSTHAHPYNRFRFEFAGKTYSVLGIPADPDSDHDARRGTIYMQDADGWTPLPNPFTGGKDFTRGFLMRESQFYAFADRCFRGDRLLLSCFLGVFEWDLKTKRWAFLAPSGDHWAFYDKQGSRVLVSNDRIGEILRFMGDPFTPDSTPQQHTDLEADLTRILRDLDDDSYETRVRANDQAADLLRKKPREVARLLNDPALAKRYSPEVIARLAHILPGPPDAGVGRTQEHDLAVVAAVGNSLLERMHPPLAADVDYRIEPGMAIEHAAAVFNAAGALYSDDIHNAHYPDISYRGYLLADRTMVYLRLETREERQLISSIGMGKLGQGNDPTWDWTDSRKNAVPHLDLKANRARYSD